MDVDAVFKALADPNRRLLLDRLNADNGQSLRELCAGLDMSRQAVTKHLAALEDANLVTTVRSGREKLHYLNAAPINDIADRWIGRYDRARVNALADLKNALEDSPMDKPSFVHTSYINTTPQRLWQALTDPAFTVRYWGAELQSDWQVGSPVLWRESPFWEEFRDMGQVVLECEPYRRLAYSWHVFQPEFAEMFGWSDAKLAEVMQEKRSKVSFEIEPAGSAVKLTVVHDDFEPGSEMLKGISQGWPAILSNLKTMLETGDTLSLEDEHASAQA